MSRFLAALQSGRVLLMDGAMGTELQRGGIQPGESCEQWNLTHPQQVRAIHQAYVAAGADVVLTNTFLAKPLWDCLRPPEEMGPTYRSALELARTAAGTERFVLLDAGPIGTPGRRFCAWRLVFAAMCGSSDALLLETCSGISDCAAVLKMRHRRGYARKRVPVLLSWTFRRARSGPPRTIHGYLPEECAECSRRYPIAALGVNCGRDIGMAEMVEIVRRYRTVTDLPLFARPNAGTPVREGERWIYPQTAEMMAARLPELLEAGVSMVGGCCGTTPEHIAAFRTVINEWNAQRHP